MHGVHLDLVQNLQEMNEVGNIDQDVDSLDRRDSIARDNNGAWCGGCVGVDTVMVMWMVSHPQHRLRNCQREECGRTPDGNQMAP
jgi:hypothetical protein